MKNTFIVAGGLDEKKCRKLIKYATRMKAIKKDDNILCILYSIGIATAESFIVCTDEEFIYIEFSTKLIPTTHRLFYNSITGVSLHDENKTKKVLSIYVGGTLAMQCAIPCSIDAMHGMAKFLKSMLDKTPLGSVPSTGEQDTIALIKEYNDLLNKGIIDQSEFDAKKKQLLGV